MKTTTPFLETKPASLKAAEAPPKREPASSSRKQPEERSFEEDRPSSPTLWFSPQAWIKLNWLAHAGGTEIGGFGLVPDPKELLVTDFILIKQSCTAVTVAFEDEAVADFFEHMVDTGHKPEQFARVWLHSHPADSAQPSTTDERTFKRVFGNCDWAIMSIVARGGQTYARLRFGNGPGGQMLIPVGVRWDLPIGDLDEAAWFEEYVDKVSDLDDLRQLGHLTTEWWEDELAEGKDERSGRHVARVDAPYEVNALCDMDDPRWDAVREGVVYGLLD